MIEESKEGYRNDMLRVNLELRQDGDYTDELTWVTKKVSLGTEYGKYYYNFIYLWNGISGALLKAYIKTVETSEYFRNLRFQDQI